MREIVVDTETTGLDPYQGDRMVEIGCIELLNGMPTGQVFHKYLNPQRDMPQEAFAVHGLSIEFLKDKPLFAEIARELMDFIGEAPIVAHNAMFDTNFINAELERCDIAPIGRERVVDTLMLARRKHPGASNRLDDLCTRYGVDNSRRTRHGALLDAELLAEVYVELTGQRQTRLVLVETTTTVTETIRVAEPVQVRPMPLPSPLSAEDLAAHAAFVAGLGGAPLWGRYETPAPRENAMPER